MSISRPPTDPFPPFPRAGNTRTSTGISGSEREIRNRISRSDQITFAEFMELALYHPEGYYAQGPRIGARGDYFTSPILHPAFGALLAVQLEIMWNVLGRPSPFWVAEPGAGEGTLANDIQSFADAYMNKFARALRYVELDRAPSVAPPDSGPHVSRIRSTGLPMSGLIGCILSNELFDASPVHRFRVIDRNIEEMYVTLDSDGRFRQKFGAPSTDRIADKLSGLPRQLPDGFQGEVNLGLANWMRDASAALDRGYILTIDYGYEADELYSDNRSGGTFQTYYKHIDGGSPYQRVGRQDMTAHVDFSALIAEGSSAGIRPVFLTTQTEFLKSLGFDAMLRSIRESDIERPAKAANLQAMAELVKPDGLGKFRVLAQEKNSGIRRSSDLLPALERIAKLRAPLMNKAHLLYPPSAGYEYGETTFSPENLLRNIQVQAMKRRL